MIIDTIKTETSVWGVGALLDHNLKDRYQGYLIKDGQFYQNMKGYPNSHALIDAAQEIIRKDTESVGQADEPLDHPPWSTT